MTEGKVCERCAGGKEYWCILKDCERDIFKSTGYALRSFVARQFSLFKDNVDVFMSLTEFAKKKLVQNGFPSKRVQVIYSLADPEQIKPAFNGNQGCYVAFAGRVSHEKGIDTLLKASQRLPDVPFKIAGKYDNSYLNLVQHAPTNVEFMGQLDREALNAFYADARMIVVPSKWYEGLPMVIIEAMLSGRPVICSDIGGLSEIVEDNSTGLLFRPDSADDFVQKVRRLWTDPEFCRRLGISGRKKAEREYSPDLFYERLMLAYETALRINGQRGRTT
jgi:glycosyltransferase involved in cell wall biosynthesis